MKPPLYVVEGHHDSAKLKLIDSNIQTWITRGSHFKDHKIEELKTLARFYDVILLLDPDGAGERIRKRIVKLFPEVKHVYIPKELAHGPKGKVGIEHMKIEDLKNFLGDVKTSYVSRETWTINDLNNLGLSGTKNAQSERYKLAQQLGLPYANVKSFCKLLNQFNISKDEVLKKVKNGSES